MAVAEIRRLVLSTLTGMCLAGLAASNALAQPLPAYPSTGILPSPAVHFVLDGRTRSDSSDIQVVPFAPMVLTGDMQLHLRYVRLKSGADPLLDLRDRARLILDHVILEGDADRLIALTDDARLEARDCRLIGGRFAGLDLSDRSAVQLDRCVIEGSRQFGLFATGQARLQLRDTIIGQCGGRGIELQDQASATLRAGRIEDHGEYGAILFGQAFATFDDVLIQRNGAHGASICQQAGVIFTACRFTANRYAGVGAADDRLGGPVQVTRCLFTGNGMRPIYRGPMHLDPMVPVPMRIAPDRVLAQADPHARIELYLDRAGEAAQWYGEVQADEHGLFQVDPRPIPAGWVLTASATVARPTDPSLRNAAATSLNVDNDARSRLRTSEFNVIAGAPHAPALYALLGRSGVCSDHSGTVHPDARLRSWPRGTRLNFHFEVEPDDTLRSYARYLARWIATWTGDAIEVAFTSGSAPALADATYIPIRHAEADAPELLNSGGLTQLRWDDSGRFRAPMHILLARLTPDTGGCPRVLAHEVGHVLGLNHARLGLLSRMQGAAPPEPPGPVNDFSPAMTCYDVLALQILYAPDNPPGATLADLARRGHLPAWPDTPVAAVELASPAPIFSPLAPATQSAQR